MEHCLQRAIAQWVHPMKDRSDYPSHHERTLLPRSYISLTPLIKPVIWRQTYGKGPHRNPLPTQHRLLNWCNKGGRKCLINDALNTFYLRLYGVRHMVKDYTDSKRGNPLPPQHRLLNWCNKGGRKCLINDALNTFYLRLYGVRHMVKDYTDSERRNPLTPQHRLLNWCNKGGRKCFI